jgi:peptidoglycan hydrolase CwlO-like protein
MKTKFFLASLVSLLCVSMFVCKPTEQHSNQAEPNPNLFQFQADSHAAQPEYKIINTSPLSQTPVAEHFVGDFGNERPRPILVQNPIQDGTEVLVPQTPTTSPQLGAPFLGNSYGDYGLLGVLIGALIYTMNSDRKFNQNLQQDFTKSIDAMTLAINEMRTQNMSFQSAISELRQDFAELKQQLAGLIPKV